MADKLDELKKDVAEFKEMNKVALAWGLVVSLVLVWLVYLTWSLATAWWAARKSAAKERMNGGVSSAPMVGTTASEKCVGCVSKFQEFTQPGQGDGYNSSLINASPNSKALAERLVNNRGEPDFWEISGELGEYRQGVSGRGMKGGNYWSPDLQQWLSEDEVAALPSDMRNNVQWYGDLGTIRDVNKMVENAPAKERFSNCVNPLLGCKENLKVLENFAMPEERLMAENFSLSGDVAVLQNALSGR